jgi:transposase
MDNLPLHKSTLMGKKVKMAGHTLLFFSLYSTFLNPIERMFPK